MIKAIVIDYYGTLVDVGQPFEEIKQWFNSTYIKYINNINDLFMAFNKERAKLQYGKEFLLGHALLMKSYKKSCEKYDLPLFPEMFRKLINFLFVEPSAFPGAQQTIKRLRKYYPVLLLTNADNHILYKSIFMQGFNFDYVLTSEDLQCNKPNKKCFQSACELLNVSPKNILMIGDSLTEDIYGAADFGMQAIWINTKKSTNKESMMFHLSSVCEIVPLLCGDANENHGINKEIMV